MSEKEILDDYYSSISKEKKDTWNDSKNKIKVKPKVLIKKKTSQDEKEENLNSKVESRIIQENKNNLDIKKDISNKKTTFSKPFEKNKDLDNGIKKEVVTATVKENNTKTTFKKDFYKKEWTDKNTYNKRVFTKKEYSNKDNQTKVIQKSHNASSGNNSGNNNINSRNTNTPNKSNEVKKEAFQKNNFIKKDFFSKDISSKNDLIEKDILVKPTFIKKDFWKDKPRSWFGSKKDNEYSDKSKKTKLSPYSKHRRFFTEIKSDENENNFIRSHKINKKSKETKNIEDIKQNLTDHAWETIIIWDILSLKELSEKIGVLLPKLLAEFMKNWMMVNLNSKIDFETASIIAESFDIKLERDKSLWINVEDIMKWNLFDLLVEEDQSKLIERPPIISIMWHVDHWKTSLLDYIRNEKVAESEAWWITQSIWAYQVIKNGKKITFLDTPWHEAFTIMRSRWVKSTDIAILVVAADEWVKPQTIESINHAKEAWISIIVAMNKMDKEWVNIDLLKSQLAEHWLISEEWWWDVPMVPVSAKTGFWIDDLLEIILLVAEMKELKANPDRLWIWTVLESHLDMKLWPVATVLINAWNINIWDNIVCKEAYWKIKVLKDYKSKDIKKAISWDPVLIAWLDKVVNWWDILQVVPTSELARDKSLEYKEIILKQSKSKTSSLDLIMSMIKSWALKNLKIVLKADTNGSLEAIKWALIKLSTPETKVSIIHSWVWNITEWDLLMCSWSSAILIWFWVDILWNAEKMLDSLGIEYINSPIIYRITEKIEKIISWMLDPKEVETIFWSALVAWIFYTWKEFMVVWLKLKEWDKIENKLKIRVIRKQKIIWKWEILSLKQWVEEVKSLEWPTECWIKFAWNVVLEEWDILEIYKNEIQK